MTTLPAYARGVDQDDDGAISNTEGSSATGAATAVGSRDALRQTAADIMTLVRAVGGTDVDTRRPPTSAAPDVTYFGQSFGGIYGTMLTGADPDVARSVLNVPGGPITEIARLSPSFRAAHHAAAAGSRPAQQRRRDPQLLPGADAAQGRGAAHGDGARCRRDPGLPRRRRPGLARSGQPGDVRAADPRPSG